MRIYILTLSGPARPGIIAAVSAWLAEKSCNITDLAQFQDAEAGRFFMRICLIAPPSPDLPALQRDFAPLAAQFGLQAAFHDKTAKMKILIMASKFSHCLYDLLYRRQTGTLPVEIAGIVANHDIYGELAGRHGIPFHYIPVSKENKAEAERKLAAVVAQSGAELIVLARYMQVLSESLCREMSGRIINIHHSFLPGFKGANPYKQAYQRGVKLIGATAHYVTADLDEGPIIEQDVIRISHAQSAADFVVMGRDVETQVLARAVLAHSQRRSFIDGARVIVLPPENGGYAPV